MVLARAAWALGALGALATAQTSTERVLPTLDPQISAAPSLTPTIYDDSAPDPQQCPGYKASNVEEKSNGFSADLNIAGPNCQAFGNDIAALTLEVQYQTKHRLNVKIHPRYISDSNYTTYMLSPDLVMQPEADGETTIETSDLKFTWSNTPSFQFKITRTSTDEELFSTYGHVIVFEDQFIELKTNMVDDYNVYGLAENIHDWRLGNNHTQTFYAVDAGNTVDGNVYSMIPWYQETRYHGEGEPTTAHGVYARNAHGQEWLLRNQSITYRTIGGTFDLYFLSGQEEGDESGKSSALTTIKQFTNGCVGAPAMQQYWTFGYHQARWGYENVSVVQEVVDTFREHDIPLECFWSDLDIYYLYRDFTNNEVTYPVPEIEDFLAGLHADNQYYVPIVDSNIYAPNPQNASDAYDPYSRGAELGTFIRDPTTDDFYFGANWPGFSVWADWLIPSSQSWWSSELARWHKVTPFDGVWIDLSEPSSFCVGSCGNGRLDENPVHPPFILPGGPLNEDYRYPEGFNVTNATAAASASSASASQASAQSANPVLPPVTTTSRGRTEPTPGVRHLSFPPYVLNSVQAGHSLLKGTVAPNATHNDASNTTEYAMHNLFGLQISNATYHALLDIFPGKRPFTVGRSVFAGSGRTTAHWGGDNTSTWGSMFLSISQALTFMMSGIPMFGPDVCGFAGNSDFQLCARWMEVGAFFPFYRNHNVKSTLSQEPYIWSSVAEASRRAMGVRYSLLTYMYTLFYYAHTEGATVMRALNWEFPEEKSLAGTYSQFMLGPSILVTPVLEPNVETVRGVFPGIGQGENWYDWYTLGSVEAQPGENVTMSAPLEHINVHIRGGSILALQEPGYTTTETKQNPYSIVVAPDVNGCARGSLYLDDGESLVQEATKMVEFTYKDGCLYASVNGSYHVAPPLANVTIAGMHEMPKHMSMNIHGQECETGRVGMKHEQGVLRMTGFEQFTGHGAWEGHMEMKMWN
ncbi:putative alpha-glucosidase AgdA [Hortaea werneckii]|nr:putative alpha-glucosidase AgdA [Hortaea werneckii]